MRAFVILIAGVAMAGCGGSAQSAAEAQAGAPVASEPDNGGELTTGGGASGASAAGETGLTLGGTAGASADAAGSGGALDTEESGSAPAGHGGGGAGAPQVGAAGMAGQSGATAIAGSGGAAQGGGGSAGMGSAGTAGSAGAPDPGVGTVVVTWTVGGIAANPGDGPSAAAHPELCACFNQYGDKGCGGASSRVVLSYGLPGKPRDSGALTDCQEVNLTKRSVPSVEFSFMIRFDRAYEVPSGPYAYSPNYAMDPAVTFTTTIPANQTVHVAVDFPVTGIDGATYSIVP